MLGSSFSVLGNSTDKACHLPSGWHRLEHNQCFLHGIPYISLFASSFQRHIYRFVAPQHRKRQQLALKLIWYSMVFKESS